MKHEGSFALQDDDEGADKDDEDEFLMRKGTMSFLTGQHHGLIIKVTYVWMFGVAQFPCCFWLHDCISLLIISHAACCQQVKTPHFSDPTNISNAELLQCRLDSFEPNVVNNKVAFLYPSLLHSCPPLPSFLPPSHLPSVAIMPHNACRLIQMKYQCKYRGKITNANTEENLFSSLIFLLVFKTSHFLFLVSSGHSLTLSISLCPVHCYIHVQ